MDLNMKTIGERIKSRRNELSLTQTAVYKAVGISSGALSELENGNRTPSMLTLYRLSKILKCSMDWITTGTSPVSENSNFSLSEDDMKILSYFHGMNDSDQEDFLMIAEMKFNKSKNKNMAKSSHSSEHNSVNEIA